MAARFLLIGSILAVFASAATPDDALIDRIWQGVQAAQQKYTSGCGSITETRTSPLLVKPRVFRGKFCADGTERFSLEYFEPEHVSIKFNKDYLNVSTGPGGKHTEVLEVGHNVRKTQAYFSKENSLGNLKKEFVIAAREEGAVYELKLT